MLRRNNKKKEKKNENIYPSTPNTKNGPRIGKNLRNGEKCVFQCNHTNIESFEDNMRMLYEKIKSTIMTKNII